MDFDKVAPGKELPDDINVIIEIPANHDPIKYEIDEDSHVVKVDRFMGTPMFYPANYGYIPQTLSDDGDPLDALVVTPYPVMPASMIRCRPVGILKMSDEEGEDAKLICVPHKKLTPVYEHVKEHSDLPPLLIQTGSEEILLAEAQQLFEKARHANVRVRLKIYDGLWHVFQVHAGLLASADQALTEGTDFLRDHLARN